MNETRGRSIDWPAVLSRAHRRLRLRLAAAGAIGAVGAALLLGGGATTRAAIDNDDPTPPPPPGGTTTTEPDGDEPILVLRAQPVGGTDGETGEESEATEEGEFTVTNESPIDADGFEVLATPQSTGVAQVIQEVPGLPGEEGTRGTFACPAGDSVSVAIESSQPHTDPVEVPCAEGPIEDPGTTATIPEPTESTEPSPGEELK